MRLQSDLFEQQKTRTTVFFFYHIVLNSQTLHYGILSGKIKNKWPLLFLHWRIFQLDYNLLLLCCIRNKWPSQPQNQSINRLYSYMWLVTSNLYLLKIINEAYTKIKIDPLLITLSSQIIRATYENEENTI